MDNNPSGFRVELPEGTTVFVGIENGIRTLRNGDVCPMNARFLGVRTQFPAAAKSRERFSYPALMFNIGLGLYMYNKFGAAALCLTGLAMYVVNTIIKNSVMVAQQRVTASAQSSTHSAASSATRREPTP